MEVFEGDKLEILVKDKPKEATAIHWYGVPVPPDQDGNPYDPVLAGEERIYRSKIPQDSARTYWYRPYSRFATSRQVFMRLTGAFVIKTRKDAPGHLKERDLMTSSLCLDKSAQVPSDSLNNRLNDREDEFIFTDERFKLKVKLTTSERIHIYNAVVVRHLSLRI